MSSENGVMTRLLVPVVVAAGLALAGCSGDVPAGQAPSPLPASPAARLLVVTHTTGFRHDSIPVAEEALRQVGIQSGLFTTEFCRTAEDVRARLTPSGLSGIDAVFFANTSGDLGIPDVQAFADWVASGKAFLGSHSASDTYHESPVYLAMLGGEVMTHGGIVDAEVRVSEPASPIVSHLAPTFRMSEEWYRIQVAGPGRTVLLKFDRNPPDGVGIAGETVDWPLTWQKAHGSGRVFYTALGHRSETWEDARFRRLLLEGIRWALAR
jgi:type 1 glutamine amidotransferase